MPALDLPTMRILVGVGQFALVVWIVLALLKRSRSFRCPACTRWVEKAMIRQEGIHCPSCGWRVRMRRASYAAEQVAPLIGENCPACGQVFAGGDAIKLWDGRSYCRGCLELACPGLAEFAVAHSVLKETLPFSFGRALWAGVGTTTYLSLVLLAVFAMIIFVGVIASQINAAQAAANFPYGAAIFFASSWAFVSMVAFPVAIVMHWRKLPRTVQLRDGRLLIRPPGEKYVPLEELRWAAATSRYDEIESMCWPRRACIVLFPEHGKRAYVGCGVGWSPERFHIWEAALTLAKVEIQPTPVSTFRRFAWRQRRKLYAVSAVTLLALAAFIGQAWRNDRLAIERMRAGDAHVHAGRFAESLNEYRAAIKLAPYLSRAYLNRGAAYAQLEQLDLALADLNRAIDLDPKSSDTYAVRSWVYCDQRRFQDALDDADHSLRLAPRNAAGLNNRGRALEEMGRLQEAVTDYSQAAATSPGNAIVLANRGRAYTKLRRYEEAMTDLDGALALDPLLYRALQRRAKVFLELGRPEQSLRDVNQALRLKPDYALGRYTRGMVLKELGRQQEAERDFTQAKSNDSDVADRY